MPYERLIREGRIKPYRARSSEIAQLLKVAERDLQAASRNLNDSPDWAYSMAYNAVLQASRALVLSEGYRPRGGEQHATVVEFIEEKLGSGYTKQVRLFDQMRRKRHRVIYETAGLISKSEAEQVIAFAKDFVEKVSVLITRQLGLMS
ncbi:MAG: HEPN domain-containing protein [Anaerolineae bacterium]|nr:HEPN domain-containing protein [Anaerolineae bacterium]